MDFESEISAMSDADKAHIAPHYTRYVQLGEDAQSAIAELDRITDQFGTSRSAMPTGQAQRHENFSRRAVRLAEDLQAAEADLTKRIDGAKRAHALVGQAGVSRSGGFGSGVDVFTRSHTNPWAGLESGDSATGYRSRAVDLLGVVADVPEAARNAFAEQIDSDHEPSALMSRWALAVGRDSYRTAFAKLLRDPQRGHMTFTDDEAHSYREVDTISRAMAVGTNGGADGGFLVPFYLDPAIILTGNGSASAIRQLARTVSTAGVTSHGVSSAGVTAEWTGTEGTEFADASPTLAQPSIPLVKADAYVPYSWELETSQPDLGAELQGLLADAYDQLTAAAFATGPGTTAPQGLLTGLTSSQKVPTASASTFAAADVYALQNALPPRFQPGASFLANLTVINLARQFETTNGAVEFPSIDQDKLLRRPLAEESTFTGTVADNAKIAVYGDISKAFTIVNGVGSRVELVQHEFGANHRPTGRRGVVLWARVGSGVVNANAARYLAVLPAS